MQYAMQGSRRTTSTTARTPASSTTRRSRRTSPRPRGGRAEPARRHGVRDLSVQPVRRVELFGGYMHMSERYTNSALQALADAVPAEHVRIAALPQRQHDAGRRDVRPGNDGVPRIRARSPAARSVSPTTRRRTSVTAGSRGRRSTATCATTFGSRPTASSRSGFNGLRSWGNNPDFLYYGGNSEMRGYEYLQFVGQRAFFANAELRFPIIEAMPTPFGVARRSARLVLRGHWRRVHQQRGVPVHDATARRPTRRSSGTAPSTPSATSSRSTGRRSRSPACAWWTAARRTASASELPARLPDALRLVVEDAVQPRLGGRALRGRTAAATSSGR